jgi:hypothetical protein
MNDVVCNYISSYFRTLSFADVVGGLAHKISFKTNGVKKIMPVCFNFDKDETNNKTDYIDVIPNSAKKSIIYLELVKENGLQSLAGMFLVDVNYKVVCWYNSHLIDFKEFSDVNIRSAIFNKLVTIKGGDVISNINISLVGFDNDLFSEYTYDNEKQFLMYPYGAFGLVINVKYMYNPSCAPDVVIDEIGCCKHPYPVKIADYDASECQFIQ